MTSVRYLFSVSCRLPIERTLLTSCFPLMLKICPEMALCIHSCTMLSLILSCWGPNTVRRLWVLKPCFLGSYGSYRPLRKKINVKLHGLKPDCTEIQADFRRQLEYRTLLQPSHPPKQMPYVCSQCILAHCYVVDLRYWKDARTLGTSFSLRLIVTIVFNMVERKNENDDKQAWDSWKQSLGKTDLWMCHGIHDGSQREVLGGFGKWCVCCLHVCSDHSLCICPLQSNWGAGPTSFFLLVPQFNSRSLPCMYNNLYRGLWLHV